MAKNLNLQLLTEGCRQGNRASQLKLYEHFYSYGMSICLRYSKSREEAMEILNDGFLRAFTKINYYDSDYSFKPWLRKILIHAAIDYHRKYHKIEETAPQAYFAEKGTSSYNLALDKLAYSDLLLVMQQLPPAYRLVFNLYVIDGMSHQDIAEQLKISVGTSKSNLARAREKLKTILDQSHGIYLKSGKNG